MGRRGGGRTYRTGGGGAAMGAAVRPAWRAAAAAGADSVSGWLPPLVGRCAVRRRGIGGDSLALASFARKIR